MTKEEAINLLFALQHETNKVVIDQILEDIALYSKEDAEIMLPVKYCFSSLLVNKLMPEDEVNALIEKHFPGLILDVVAHEIPYREIMRHRETPHREPTKEQLEQLEYFKAEGKLIVLGIIEQLSQTEAIEEGQLRYLIQMISRFSDDLEVKDYFQKTIDDLVQKNFFTKQQITDLITEVAPSLTV